MTYRINKGEHAIIISKNGYENKSLHINKEGGEFLTITEDLKIIEETSTLTKFISLIIVALFILAFVGGILRGSGLLDKLENIFGDTIPRDQGYENLSPFQFEKYIANLFKDKGYRANVTPRSGDYGADVIAERGEEKIGIQVKKLTNGNVGVKDINHLLGSMYYYNANKAIIITTTDFTEPAKNMARTAPIELWNKRKLDREIMNILTQKGND